jgi:hypothetical protein
MRGTDYNTKGRAQSAPMACSQARSGASRADGDHQPSLVVVVPQSWRSTCARDLGPSGILSGPKEDFLQGFIEE